MATKQELIDKIIRTPLEFSEAEFNLLKTLDISFTDLRQMLIRLFDINEASLKQESDANTGMMGRLNRYSTRKRQKKYFRQIRNGFRVRSDQNKNNKLIVAEGDSWFQFPLFITDIIDWLQKEPHYAIYSIAYGGDWFANILYEEKYIEELSIHRPDVFLISGCGNDFVGASRLAIMVNNEGKCKTRNSETLSKMLQHEKDEGELLQGYHYITEAFYSFIWTVRLQYWLLFDKLGKSEKYQNMRIITQGYDNVIPTYKRRWRKWYRLQPLLNWVIGSGKWLKHPMMIKGIDNSTISKNIMKALIFEINYMFAQLAEEFPNVYHIDCRGTAGGWNGWFDELHLHSEKFRLVAMKYKEVIDGTPSEKVIYVIPRGKVEVIIPEKV